MSLEIVVGHLAYQLQHDADGAAMHRATLDSLNALLAEAGEPPHVEPDSITGDTRSWQSYGYAGLHYLRRLAAWHGIHQRLPPPCSDAQAASDAALTELYRQHDDYLSIRHHGDASTQGDHSDAPPPFAHLLLHSDAEGFYLPRPLPVVLFDMASPQRGGIGGMVGSAQQLLKECHELAALMALPEDIDPNSDEIRNNVHVPVPDGAPWQRYGIESYVLTRLIAACEASLATGAAIVFT